MFLIRSAGLRDLKAVLALARHLDSYNLPAERSVLQKLLRTAEASFRGRIKQKEKTRFLFVAEDAKTGKIAGCSLIIPRHGTPGLPHLAFQIGAENKTSRFLSKRIEHSTLKLHSDAKGFTEIGGLVVLPPYRQTHEKLGKQLSYARFAYMAARPAKFERRVIVEYLPKLDPRTGNRLWELVGQKFTGLGYHQADKLSAANKEFILSLFPKEKIYCCLLPDAVVRHLGMPGPGAKISLGMLEKIGFRFLRQIDPFDGGPHYGALLSNISIIKKTTAFVYKKGVFREKQASPRRAMVSFEKNGEVKAVVTVYGKSGRFILLPRDSARTLGLSGGEKVLATPFDGESA